MSAPIVPARPSRSQQHQQPTANMDIPRIPPRPKRNVERSVSPNRDSFARSPLNDPSFSQNRQMYRVSSNLSTSVPQRPPSVELPSIGQEGNEYAHLGQSVPDEPAVSQQTKNVAGDLPLHAPKASLPAGAAKARVAAVTRTDSDQAAALGLGRPSSRHERPSSRHGRPSSRQGDKVVSDSRGHSRSNSETVPSRPGSILKDNEHEEHGIPEIGVQIPLYPNAGDVQAPTPSPYDSKPHTAGVGFFNDGSLAPKPRKHERTKSGREIFTGPPGSYGLHGHGLTGRDQFERAWYEKHPEEQERESQGAYGPAIADNRKDWALSSDQLNRLVHRNVNNVGTSKTASLRSLPPGNFLTSHRCSRSHWNAR